MKNQSEDRESRIADSAGSPDARTAARHSPFSILHPRPPNAPDARSAAAAAVLDYCAHGCRKFKEHLRDHLANGYVISTPSAFMMFKAVALEDNRVAWYITYARGDVGVLLAAIPFPLPWFAWRRYRNGRETLRVYPFERVAQLVPRHSQSSILDPRHV